MQHVKMTETRDGASDRITVRTYHEGNVYEVSDELAELFLDDGAAEPADASEAAENVPALEELDDEQLLAKVLEVDPEANSDDVKAAIAANRDGVLDVLRELEALDDEGGDDKAPADDVDAEFADLSNKALEELAQLEGIPLPKLARSRQKKIDAIKAGRAAKGDQ